MESGSKTKKPSKLGAKLSAGREEALMKGLELSYKERLQSCEELYSELYSGSDDGRKIRSPKKAFAAGAVSAAALIVVVIAVFAAVRGNDNENIAAVSGETLQSDIASEADSTESVTEISETESYAEISSEAVAETETVTETTVDENILASGNTENGEWQLTSDGVLTVDVSGAVSQETAEWSEYSDRITEMVLGENVTEIGKKAFKDHTNLRTVHFNGKLEKIGDQCFMGCTALESADIPESVVSIGRSAFEASGITSLTIYGASEIEDKAFYQCKKLTDVSLGNAVWSDEAFYMFNECTSLESISIPQGVEIITTYQFSGCTALTDVTIPESVVQISNNAFSDCVSLEEISLPEKMKAIDTNAFLNCIELRTVNMSKSIDEFTLSAFNGCSKYNDIYLPETVGSINLKGGGNSIHFPDNFSYKELRNYDADKEYIGSGKNSLLVELYENGCNITITDDCFIGNYISGNIYYVNKVYESAPYIWDENLYYAFTFDMNKGFSQTLGDKESDVEYMVISDDIHFENELTHELYIDYLFPNMKGVYIPPHIELYTEPYEIWDIPDEFTFYTTNSDYNYVEQYVEEVKRTKKNADIDLQYVSSYDEMIKIAKGE